MTVTRVLVTGATGFIGVEVARLLAAERVRSRLMVRRPHRARYVRDHSDDLVAADLADPRSLARAVSGMDAVIHLAGRATFESYDVVRPTLVEGTAALARAAADAGVRRIVFASSTMVYDGRGGPVDERTPAAPRSGYGRAKLEAEEALGVAASAGAFGLGVLRLPHVYGARDAMFGMCRRGWLISPGAGDAPFSHLHVRDAARALIRAATGGWTGTAPIADDEAATWREFIGRLRRATPHFRELRVPAPVAWLAAHLPALLARRRDRPTLMTPDAVAGWNRSLVVAPCTSWRALGLEPHFPTIASGIAQAAGEPVHAWVHPVADGRGG